MGYGLWAMGYLVILYMRARAHDGLIIDIENIKAVTMTIIGLLYIYAYYC
jgi:hypothetical protein